jgi:signal transduction histidine kinase
MRLAAQGEQARVARVSVMGEFAASIAHELNQPLAAIVLNAGAALKWLSQDPPGLAQARAALGAILDASTNASDIVRCMNDMARKSAPEHTVFALDEAVAEVLLLLRAKLHRHGITVRTEFAPDQRQLRANRAQFKQVLMNLFLNAIEAMDGVDDRARVLDVRAQAGAARGSVLISVADSGRGIAPSAGAHLFEPLFSTRADGMGMGLSICRSIVEAHGGRIWSSPRQPHGSVFRLSLPAAYPCASLASAAATPAP